MKITGIAFSYSNDSMNLRGLSLMDHYINFYHFDKLNLPMCDSNKPDGIVPPEVELLDNKIRESDVLVFAIPEYTGHYSVGFKNFMDWIVVKSNYNADLGQQYCISNKSIYVITFTPSKPGAGDRHFDMSKHLIEKLGGRVKNMFVKNNCWDHLTPNNYNFVEKECREINRINMNNEVNNWCTQYDRWNEVWKN